ncbi:MAG: D-tyrosyl-tRNA(Tyr) deacylase [Planctomycetota bacterium]|jgi:D-tyrosyl-tRNA(Tyr) deacylase|uniref:D-aminoacyl-tRNA deacylase n=1 Tax=Patiriisocius sp. Uisw_047 TaxID=3230969 RepID=UPI0039E897A7
MRALIQRVSEASVRVDNTLISEIGTGMLILLGVEAADTEEDIQWLTNKISNLRIFDDEEGVMNLSLKDTNGAVLVVSQFTLHASTKKGNRPSYIKAARPEFAEPMYEQFVKQMSKSMDNSVQTGRFGAMMEISLINSGPITLFVDTKNKE